MKNKIFGERANTSLEIKKLAKCTVSRSGSLFVPTPRSPHFALHDDVISVNFKSLACSDNNFSLAESTVVLHLQPENSR